MAPSDEPFPSLDNTSKVNSHIRDNFYKKEK